MTCSSSLLEMPLIDSQNAATSVREEKRLIVSFELDQDMNFLSIRWG